MRSSTSVLNTPIPNWTVMKVHVDGLAQDCSSSIANTLELLQSCWAFNVMVSVYTSLVISVSLKQISGTWVRNYSIRYSVACNYLSMHHSLDCFWHSSLHWCILISYLIHYVCIHIFCLISFICFVFCDLHGNISIVHISVSEQLSRPGSVFHAVYQDAGYMM